jgi:hypothetical protein
LSSFCVCSFNIDRLMLPVVIFCSIIIWVIKCLFLNTKWRYFKLLYDEIMMISVFYLTNTLGGRFLL